MIAYDSRAGRLIRSLLGGVIGGSLALLAIMRADALEGEAPPADDTQAAQEAKSAR